MRTTFRRLILLFCALRYGAKLLWAAAPHKDRVRWFMHLASSVHASASARGSLHRALPQLGPLLSAFTEQALTQPDTFARSVHDVFSLLAAAETELTKPLPPSEVVPALAKAMGRAPDSVFASIELVPLESRVAEQIHAARLRARESSERPDGGYVDTIVKLLRAKEVQRIGDDIAVLGWVARVLERFLPAAREIGVHAMAQSLGAEVQRRFDLRTEAANLSQTSRHFQDDARVVVPEVVWELSTDHVLVTERIESAPMTDLEMLRLRGIDLEALAERIVEVVVEQAFAHGFFHAALDAEHLRVSIEQKTLGRLVFGDGKVMATLTEPERAFFVHGASALFEQDYARLAAMHREAGHVEPGTRDEVLSAELRTRAEPHFAAPSGQRSPAALLAHLLGAVEPFDGGVSPALTLAHEAIERAESLALALAPGFDTWQVVKGTLKALAREDIGHRGWIKRLSRELPHLAAMPRLPTLVAQRLQHMYDGTHERHEAAVWLAELRHEQRRTRRLLWACAVGGALLGAGAVWLGR
ncbi:ABC1 kinase family protein [Trinickia dinghuensis]|uniref:ABC transporter n=1 Tax=Trinickia dinghuensis TaxID=2291023 RepID=A0A3D8JTU8_9BURK|nr:AarF/UbiB family protein [Trinickia dinghuensis]RDU96310.1 ABC transporter [Trinickia dinghuensis]